MIRYHLRQTLELAKRWPDRNRDELNEAIILAEDVLNELRMLDERASLPPRRRKEAAP